MKTFLLGLSFVVAFLVNPSSGMCATLYYAKALGLRTPRLLVPQPVLVPNLRPLALQKIEHGDDAWRIGHWLADADNYYTREIELKRDTFLEMPNKSLMIGRLTLDLYRQLEDTSPSISLIDLRRLLFHDHDFHESVETLVCSGYKNPEFPFSEAVRLGKLFYKLPTR